ncbi:hypothetical protein VKT23_015337 [Stygiomarasmius scandens]|uniref:Uncharacterized protein n=1 Tax=Marasmiellus scandens TaxID=2682957 RepID=A0ABR1IY99_9AGAR
MGVNNGDNGEVDIPRNFSHPSWANSQDSTSSSFPPTPLSGQQSQCQNYYNNFRTVGVNNGDFGRITLGYSNTNQNGTSQSTEVAQLSSYSRESQNPRPTGHSSPQGLPSNRPQVRALPPPDLGENIRSQVRGQNRTRPGQPTIPDSSGRAVISHGGQSRSQNSNSQSSRRHGQ